MLIAIITLSLTTLFFLFISIFSSWKIGKESHRIIQLRKAYNALAKETNEYAAFINRIKSDDFEIDGEEFNQWAKTRIVCVNHIHDWMKSL